MKIQVTQEHIKCGLRMTGYNCPVALAIQETLNMGTVYVQADVWYIFVGDKQHITPLDVRNFIYLFDSGKPVQPFSFEL